MSNTAPPAPKTPASESEFLTRQAAEARQAISRVVSDLKHDIAQGVDPRAWIQTAPWTTLAGAAVAGFVAAAAVIPSKEQQALKRLAEIEKALNPPGRYHRRNGSDNDDAVHAVESGRGSFLSGLAGQVLRAVQPVLMSAITAGVTAKTVDSDKPTGGVDPSDATAQNPPPETAADGSDPGI